MEKPDFFNEICEDAMRLGPLSKEEIAEMAERERGRMEEYDEYFRSLDKEKKGEVVS